VAKKATKSCRFTVGTAQGRNQTSFPISRNGWKEAIAHAQQRSREGHDVYDINFSCSPDDPFGPRSLFLVTCASGFKSREYVDPNDPRNPSVCTTVYAQRTVHDTPSPVLGRRANRRERR
jgi:hypothetical protein